MKLLSSSNDVTLEELRRLDYHEFHILKGILARKFGYFVQREHISEQGKTTSIEVGGGSYGMVDGDDSRDEHERVLDFINN